MTALLGARAQSERILGRYVPQRWSTEQGLASGRIFSLAQTPDGYLWIATEKDLLRFDGFNFQPIPTIEGLPASSVTNLVVDRRGTLWLHTQDAQLLRVDEKLVSSVISHRENDESIIAVTPAQSSGVLVSEIGRGILRVEGRQQERLYLKAPKIAVSLTQAASGTIWLGERGGGLYRSNGRELRAVATVPADTKINCMLPIDGNKLWLGTDQGLLLLDERTSSVDKPTSALRTPQVLTMAQDHEGQLWVGTSEGLLRFSEQSFEWVLHTGRAVTAVLADREGNIWFGDGPNLERLHDTPVMTYNLPPSVGQSGIGPVATDKRGRIWFAPARGGLYWMLNGLVHRVTAAGIDHDVVYSIDCHEDDVWLGRMHGGLTRLHTNGESFEEQTWTTKDGLLQNSIYAVRTQRDGSVWTAGLTIGISHLVKGHFVNYDTRQLGSASATAIEPANDGSVWFATPNGLIRFDAGRWEQFAERIKLPSDEVLSLCVDDRNGLFVGTSLGLAYIEGKQHDAVQLPSALPRDPVLAIALDGHGSVWFSTTSQVFSLFDPTLRSSLTVSAPAREYTIADGLSNSAGVRRARSMVSDTSGRIYFATQGGLSVTNKPSSYAAVPAFARMESIIADGSPLSLKGPAFIPPGTRRITFNFAGLDLRAPEQVRLRYRLDDFDKDWSEPTSSRQATYTNLQPGSYRFRLLAKNSQGEWSEQETTLPVVVEPLLQQRWSFRIAVTAVFVLLAIWFFRARMNAVMVQVNALAEERHAERNRIARELHDTLLQGMVSVMLRLNVIAETVAEPTPVRGSLNSILDLMERVIDDARLAVQGLRNSECQAIDLEQFFHDAGLDMERDSTSTYNVEVRGQKRSVRPPIYEEMTRIGIEAIQNAIRHSQANLIAVSICYAKSSLSLEISDDGVGMDAELISTGRAGHWGIVGMRERAKRMGGHLDIVSSIGKGSTVSLVIPARLAYVTKRRTNGPDLTSSGPDQNER